MRLCSLNSNRSSLTEERQMPGDVRYRDQAVSELILGLNV
jgi:hypothetical protein